MKASQITTTQIAAFYNYKCGVEFAHILGEILKRCDTINESSTTQQIETAILKAIDDELIYAADRQTIENHYGTAETQAEELLFCDLVGVCLRYCRG